MLSLFHHFHHDRTDQDPIGIHTLGDYKWAFVVEQRDYGNDGIMLMMKLVVLNYRCMSLTSTGTHQRHVNMTTH
jgi:hypothetical protein